MRASCSRISGSLGELVGELAQRLDRLDEAVLLGVVEDEPRARVPELRVALASARAQSVALGACAAPRSGYAGSPRAYVRGRLRACRRRASFGSTSGCDERRGDVGDALDVRERTRAKYARDRVGSRRLRGATIASIGFGSASTVGRPTAYGARASVSVVDAARACRRGSSSADRRASSRTRATMRWRPSRTCTRRRSAATTPHSRRSRVERPARRRPSTDDRALHGDDDVAVARAREERLDVEDAVSASAPSLAARHAVLLALEDCADVSLRERVGRPTRGPRPGLLGGERAPAIGRAAVPERARECAGRASAAARLHDEASKSSPVTSARS